VYPLISLAGFVVRWPVDPIFEEEIDEPLHPTGMVIISVIVTTPPGG